MEKSKLINLQLPSKEQTEEFDILFPMLLADLGELRELSKKKQDGVLNSLKVKTINKKLVKVKALLTNEPTTEFLELLDDETLPTNSDAVFLVIQFKAAMTQFKEKYTYVDESDIWASREWRVMD